MTKPGAPPPVPPGYGLAPVIPLPGLVPRAPQSYEVIRRHDATGRVQLAGWNIPTWQDAVHEADRSNDRAREDGGRTLASSGLRESGWIYVARKAGTP